jgi:polyhydroxybutyrate depolymerase
MPAPQPGDYERQLTVNGLARSYLLHVPPGLNGLQPVPVVFIYHGYSGNSSGMQTMTGFNEIADNAVFLAVYPEGTGTSNSNLSWDAGRCCRSDAMPKVDETAFVRQILADLETMIGIDPKRIYATGFSNGAMLTYRLACDMSDTFAAVAPVSGVLVYSPCQPQQPVSVIHIHGLADTAVPYAGEANSIPGGFPPVEDSINAWVQLNGCTGTAQVEQQQNIITHTVYASCQSGTAVELYTIDLLGHAWPSKYVLPASQLIWDFFAAHPKP